MKIKTSKLTGPALDWAAATAEGFGPGYMKNIDLRYNTRGKVSCMLVPIDREYVLWSPSTDWAQGGPILTEARISRTIDHSGLWVAYIAEGYGEPEDDRKFMQCDRSELVAGHRCYVASKLGDEVEIPNELLEAYEANKLKARS